MSNYDVDRSRVWFLNLTEMLWYKGLEAENIAMSETTYCKENGYGHELFNFLPDDGRYYGYSPPGSTCNLKSIAKDAIEKDEHGRFIDNVLVIFTSTRTNKGHVIVGYYKNAKVYEKPLKRKETLGRYIKQEDDYAKYNMVCDIKNGRLIEHPNRNYYIPHASSEVGGFGMQPRWYAAKKKDQEIREKAIDYILGLEASKKIE